MSSPIDIEAARKVCEGASFCAICGPGVRVDEDGCCVTCGATVMGEAVEVLFATFAAALAELTQLRQDAGLASIRERQLREQLAQCEGALRERDVMISVGAVWAGDFAQVWDDMCFIAREGGQCAYCKESMLKDDMPEHIRSCEAHPLADALHSLALSEEHVTKWRRLFDESASTTAIIATERDAALAELAQLRARAGKVEAIAGDKSIELDVVRAERNTARQERDSARAQLAKALTDLNAILATRPGEPIGASLDLERAIVVAEVEFREDDLRVAGLDLQIDGYHDQLMGLRAQLATVRGEVIGECVAAIQELDTRPSLDGADVRNNAFIALRALLPSSPAMRDGSCSNDGCTRTAAHDIITAAHDIIEEGHIRARLCAECYEGNHPARDGAEGSAPECLRGLTKCAEMPCPKGNHGVP